MPKIIKLLSMYLHRLEGSLGLLRKPESGFLKSKPQRLFLRTVTTNGSLSKDKATLKEVSRYYNKSS